MEEFWILILVTLFGTNSLDKAESVQLEELEELPLQTFDELFVDEWLDKDEAEDLKMPPGNYGQIESNSTDQLGQIEPNSTDQLGQIEPNSTDQPGQIEPNSTDQNPPLTESDRSGNAKNGEEMICNEKRKMVDKFHAIKDEFKKNGKYSKKVWTKIDKKIAKHLKVSRTKIYKWKKELGLSRKTGINYSDYEKLKIVKKLMQIKSDNSGEGKKSCKEIDNEIAERFGVNVRTINQWKKEFSLSRRRHSKNARKILVEKFDQKKAELKRNGFKNSYNHAIDETVAKELGVNFLTLYKWKHELGQTKPYRYTHNEQKELMKRYFEIKEQNPKMSVGDIAKILKIGRDTLYIWKRQLKRMHPNSENIGPEGLFG